MAGLLNKLRMMDAAPVRPLREEKKERQDGNFFLREAVFPVSTFCDRSFARPALLETIFRCPFPSRVEPEDVLFLDTETTGLSGGVGTVAFQIGLGYFTPAGFAVEQFLMRDYPEEEAMLRTLAARLGRFTVLCTFNGRSFDVPLLKSRFLMNGMREDPFPVCHADVLYPARRLWKLRLGQCNLGALEEALLGVRREDDLPGALVPQTYFQYLKDGNFSPLEKILDHNRQDVVSLAQLFYALCMQTARPEEMERPEDLFSWARSLEKQGERAQAMKCYRLCRGGAFQAQAERALATNEKREGRYLSSVKLLEGMLCRGEDPVFACEALAKLYEHQLREPEQALHYARQALLLLAEPGLRKDPTVQEKQNALQYRYARLRRRLEERPAGKR